MRSAGHRLERTRISRLLRPRSLSRSSDGSRRSALSAPHTRIVTHCEHRPGTRLWELSSGRAAATPSYGLSPDDHSEATCKACGSGIQGIRTVLGRDMRVARAGPHNSSQKSLPSSQIRDAPLKGRPPCASPPLHPGRLSPPSRRRCAGAGETPRPAPTVAGVGRPLVAGRGADLRIVEQQARTPQRTGDPAVRRRPTRSRARGHQGGRPSSCCPGSTSPSRSASLRTR